MKTWKAHPNPIIKTTTTTTSRDPHHTSEAIVHSSHPPITTIPNEKLSDFSYPWCAALSDDPTLQPIPTASRITHPSTGENSLLASHTRQLILYPRRPDLYQTRPQHILLGANRNLHTFLAGSWHGGRSGYGPWSPWSRSCLMR